MAKFYFVAVCSLLAVLSHSTLGNAADPCDQDPCQNTGTCTSGINSTGTNPLSSGYQCTCPNGYTGTNCEIDLCANVSCLNGGTCRPRASSNTGYICKCIKNFLGKHCEREANACRSLPCLNGGECRNRPATGSYMCRCLPGSSGDQCENNANACRSLPCLNGGECRNQPATESYICRCPPGTSGEQCQINADDCANSPCGASDTCTDLVGGYECVVDFSSLVNVSCNGREMTVTLNASLLDDGGKPSSLYLNNDRPTCTGVFNQDESKIQLSTPYQDCDTMVEEKGGNIIFSNTVRHTENVITTQTFVELPVECIMRKKETVHGPLYRIIRDKTAKLIQGHGQFELMLERYSNDNFDALPSSENVRIRDKLYYAVSLNSSADIITVLLDACWATPSSNDKITPRYDLIVDGCPVDHHPPVNMYTDLGPLKQGFTFHAFGFVGHSQAYVHCDVTVCVTTAASCGQGACPQRLRRSLRDVPSLMKPKELHSQAFLFSEHSRDGL